ncbi:MAG TPA: hypothetical protein ENK57_04435 [Polyangiaceae bacterium]|nr:hypothetical protein [Polyangiaceae bacterium]
MRSLHCSSLVAVALVAACGPAQTSEDGRTLGDVLVEAPDAQWRYEVRVDPALARLEVDALLEEAATTTLGVDAPAEAFIEDVNVWDGRGWRSVTLQQGTFDVPECRRGCRLRYGFALAEAAAQVRDEEVAGWGQGAVLSPPSAWLLRPPDDGIPFAFAVRPARGVDFVSGVWPHARAEGVYSGDSVYLWRSPYSAFGRFERERLAVGGGVIEVAIVAGEQPLDRAATLRWIEGSAATVAEYFGRFPVPRVLVLVLPRPGQRIHGKEIGGGGASIILHVGAEASEPHFARDWVNVHEMIHLGVPAMPREHLWLTEGLATYVEPLARARRGELDVEKVWRDMMEGMVHGLPEEGDRGLDRTPTWGRTYWGGALFALVADLEIRKRTGSERSLDDALRAVVRAGGHNGVFWSIRRFLEVGDRATQTTVLTEQYDAWAGRPVMVELAALWRDLGVALEDGAVRFDDEAPLAEHRRALTAPSSL